MQEYAKHNCLIDVIYFLRRISKKKNCLHPETVSINRPTPFEERLRGGKLVQEDLRNMLDEY